MRCSLASQSAPNSVYMMNEPGKSDSPEVPGKSSNKARQPAAEGMEGNGLAKGNLQQQNTSRTPSRSDVPSALERVRCLAGVQCTPRASHPATTRQNEIQYPTDRLAGASGSLSRYRPPRVPPVPNPEKSGHGPGFSRPVRA